MQFYNKVKYNKYQTVVTVPKHNIKNVKKAKTDSPNTHIHDRSPSLLDTCISLKRAG